MERRKVTHNITFLFTLTVLNYAVQYSNEYDYTLRLHTPVGKVVIVCADERYVGQCHCGLPPQLLFTDLNDDNPVLSKT